MRSMLRPALAALCAAAFTSCAHPSPTTRPAPAATASATAAATAGGTAPVPAPAANSPRATGPRPGPDSAFLPIAFDEKTGKLTMEVKKLDYDFLYTTSLATGLGSNSLGLDRASLGNASVVRFQRIGARLFLIEPNLNYRGTADTVSARTVGESFAPSILASFPIIQTDTSRTIIDITDFAVNDVYDVIGTIQRSQQGSFRLDKTRSSVYPTRTKAFPKNTEVEVMLTFESSAPGREVNRNAADGHALTLREHLSFVELPDAGYKPRAFDPRIGFFSLSYMDFSQPFNRSPQVSWMQRWRLEKKDPSAAISEPVKPIVYYLDRGVPEPYRTAFKQGAAWWNDVFQAAGFRNAFRVEDLPPDADPMDARYSVIEWVHRSEPGFSVGQSFVDPRTGEIIKAALKMDTYRSYTDFNVFAGLEPALESANDDWIASLDPNVNGFEFTMARRRQHVAHEIGHTLGLAHNYIAHAYGRGSVMDYPGPLVTLRSNGTVDASNAFRAGPGSYDTLAIRYAYTQYPSDAAEKAGLTAIMNEGLRNGLRYLTDSDAGAGVNPDVTRWLNGNDAVAELERQTKVRDVLLSKFSDQVIATGDPMSLLNQRLTPVYLHHRYAIEAAIKAVGGMEYTFALKGDGQVPTQIVDPARQRRALTDLLYAISPKQLAIPMRIVERIPPTPTGIDEGWSFDSPAGITFDPIAVARALSGYVADGILTPDRIERVIAFHARNPAEPSADEVLQTMTDAVFANTPVTTAYEASLRRAARRAVLDAMISLASNPRATADTRAVAEYQLNALAARAPSMPTFDTTDRAANATAVRDIRNWLDHRIAPPRTTSVIPLPPGTPIGN